MLTGNSLKSHIWVMFARALSYSPPHPGNIEETPSSPLFSKANDTYNSATFNRLRKSNGIR